MKVPYFVECKVAAVVNEVVLHGASASGILSRSKLLFRKCTNMFRVPDEMMLVVVTTVLVDDCNLFVMYTHAGSAPETAVFPLTVCNNMLENYLRAS